MKCFLISNMYPTTKEPGYGSFVKNVACGLEERGIKMQCVSVIKGRGKNKFEKILKYFKFFLSIIFNFFRSYDFIYIHFPNQAIPLLSILYEFRQTPIIINFHGEDLIYEKEGYSNKLGKMTEAFCKKYATAIVVPSSYFKNIVVERKLSSPENVIISASGGINEQIFYPKKQFEPNHKLHLGYVGRLEEDKGIYEFLYLCNRLKSQKTFYATIIGYGTCYQETIDYIKNNHLEDNIHVINGLPQSELGDYYRKFDLFVFLSSRDAESLGLTGIEAMACGTPVIGNNIGGIKTYVIDGVNGWIVDRRNLDKIVSLINDYIDSPTQTKETIKKQCITTAKNYYRDRVLSILTYNITNQLKKVKI